VDPLELPPDRFVNLIYFWLSRGRDEQEMATLDSELSQPLPGREPTVDVGVWSPEAEMAQFLAAQAATAG